jgi:hypothetical protein
VWYEDAVAKIKETSTVSDEVKAEAAAPDKQ